MATLLPYERRATPLSQLAQTPQQSARTALPPAAPPVPAAPAGTGLPAPRTGIVQAAQASGPRTINMGMVEEVPRTALPAPAAGAAPAMAAAPTALSRVARVAGPAAVGLGIAGEGAQVANVASNPNSTSLDVGAQVATGAGRLASAGLGAKAGAALGALAGPLAPVAVPLGAIAGGAGGYWAADKAIDGGRSLAARAMAGGTPAAASGPSAYPDQGGAAFGVFPQMPQGGTPATPQGTQAQVRALDNNPANTAAIAGAGTPPTAPVAAAPAPFGGGPVNDGTRLGLVGAAGVTSADRVGQMNRSAEASRGLSQMAIEQARLGVGGPTPGMGVIGPVDYANRNADFNDGAALRTAAARGSWSPRRGFQSDEGAIQAAGVPLAQRAAERMAAQEQAGALERTQLQEQGANARERIAAGQRAESNDIARQRLAIDAATAGLQPGYRRTANGGVEPIPGSPASVEAAEREKTRQAGFDSTRQTIGTINRLLSSPGRTGATGTWNLNRHIPGTDAADFAAEVETLKAQTFLPMVQQLRGMGALSNAEGDKLNAAVGALNFNMSEKAFAESLGRIRDQFGLALQRAGIDTRDIATWGTNTPSTVSNAQRPAPAVGAVESGYVFLGGDPSNQASWRKQ